jgi:hypothetical protein
MADGETVYRFPSASAEQATMPFNR